jgi:hypothetical protein
VQNGELLQVPLEIAAPDESLVGRGVGGLRREAADLLETLQVAAEAAVGDPAEQSVIGRVGIPDRLEYCRDPVIREERLRLHGHGVPALRPKEGKLRGECTALDLKALPHGLEQRLIFSGNGA